MQRGNGKLRAGFPVVPVPSGGKSLGGSNPGRDEESGGGAVAAAPGRSLLRPRSPPFPWAEPGAPRDRAGAGAELCRGRLRARGEARRGPAVLRGRWWCIYPCIYLCIYVCVRGLLPVRAASPPAFRFLSGFTCVLLGECWFQSQRSQAPEAERRFVLKPALFHQHASFTLVCFRKYIGKLQEK